MNNNDKIKNILVIRMRRFGDAILTEALCASLKLSFPNAKIDYVVNEEITPLFTTDPNINEVISITKDERENFPKYIKKVRSIIKKTKYDIIIDVRSNPRTWWLLLFSYFRTKYKIGIKKSYKNVLYSHTVDYTLHKKDSYIGMMLSFMKPLEKDFDIKYTREFTTYLDKDEKENFKKHMEEAGVDFSKNIVAVSCNTREEKRKWSDEYMKELVCMMIKDYNAQIILYHGPGEKEATLQFQKYIDDYDNTFTNIETKNIRELACVISNCDFFFGNEGGPRHIAQSLGVPSFATYYPSGEKIEWLPYVEMFAEGIEAEDIDPEYVKIEDQKERFSKVTPDMVKEKVKPMLDFYLKKK